MGRNEKVDLLMRVPGLSSYRDKSLAPLAALVDEMRVEPGAVLTKEGSPAQEAYIIVEGIAVVSIRGRAIAKLGPGEFVGEMSMLDPAPRSATVSAETPMRLLVTDPRRFQSLAAHPGIARALARSLSRRLRDAEGAAFRSAGLSA